MTSAAMLLLLLVLLFGCNELDDAGHKTNISNLPCPRLVSTSSTCKEDLSENVREMQLFVNLVSALLQFSC